MKKLTALLLALVMTFGMVACGSKTNETTTTPSTGDTSNTDTTDTGDTGDTPTEDTGSGETLYIPVMAKGFQHAYWQAVKQGADQAAEELGVEIYFAGPASETNIDEQVNMVKTELAKNPKAMALAALSTDSVTEILAECAEKNIPVIGFDSGVPGDTTGAVKATAATDNEAAAAIAAEKFGENETVVAAMQNATSDAPIVIGCLSQDAVSASVTGRTTGFVNKMAEIAETYQPGKVSIEGHTTWEKKVENPAIIIRVEVSATTEATSLQTSASALLGMEGITAIFCSNEGAVTGFLAATSDGSDLGEGGKYEGLVVAGFDAGSAQKNAVRNGWFIGSVTQDPVQIGYQAVALAVAAANGEEVADVDTGAKWYDATNIDDPDMATLVYD
ncbi:MAG TPA: substrate-binding domain-containing protein [Candidatus Avoscillospira avistercoris]|uniref:Substrate-binding domain-containing protein n=1 Tax=Candidatus Avoscillospira avistercoris TaxID=2840707 RepID=A0A9D1FB96_9FIRM|nr:substrate-binding domain-containing protein [Candidatus Avoscillospira avistercoris]